MDISRTTPSTVSRSPLFSYSDITPEHSEHSRQFIDSHLNRIGVISAAERSARSTVVLDLLEASKGYAMPDRAILLAIAEQESHFDPFARNPNSSAKGVFQIIDATWRGLGMQNRDPLDHKNNIEAGLKLYEENLQVLERRFTGKLSASEKLIEMYTLHHDGPFSDHGGRDIARKRVLPKFWQWMEILPKLK